MKPMSFKSERETLVEQAKAAKVSLAWLSRALGRSDRYLDRFAAGGPPRALARDDRKWLSMFFAVDEKHGMGVPADRDWDE